MKQSVHSNTPQFKDYEKLYRLLIEDLKEYAIFMMDPGGTLVSWNAGVERILGYTEQEFVGRHVSMLFVPEDRQAGVPDRELGRAAKEGRAPDERWHERKDGRRIWVDGMVTSILDENRLAGFSKIMRDATRRWMAENEMKQSAERFRGIFANAKIGMAVTDLDLRFVEVNHALCDITGYTKDELTERDMRSIIHAGDIPNSLKMTERMVAGEIPSFVLEKRFIHKNGREVWVRNSVSLMRTSQGKPDQIVTLIEDITERKQAEERLRQSQKLESIGLLAGGVAHDFNNLLTGVIGNASLATANLPEQHPARLLLDEVMQSGRKAAELTRQLLAYAGKGNFILEHLDLSDCVSGIVNLIQTSIPEKVSLQFDLARDLPKIEADPSQIQQIIMNLVINAAEAIDNSPGTITISTGVERLEKDNKGGGHLGDSGPGDYVFLRVRDTGPGMDEETRRKIFDPFFTTKFTGRGLGLAAVSGIIRAHKGDILVESAPGAGSTFRVLFPVFKPEGKPEPRKNAKRVPAEAELLGTGTILIADDDAAVRGVSQAALERYGYTVLTAANGAEAVEIFRQRAEEIAALLLDIAMPVMSGEDAFREIHKIRPGVPIVVTSGYNDVVASERFQAAGGVASFLQKPYTAGELAAKIKAVLRG